VLLLVLKALPIPTVPVLKVLIAWPMVCATTADQMLTVQLPLPGVVIWVALPFANPTSVFPLVHLTPLVLPTKTA